MVNIGLDVGFGKTKVCMELKGKRVLFSFPSWIAYGDESKLSEIKRYGGKYWIGEEALYSDSVFEIATIDELIKFYPLFREKVIDIIKSKFVPDIKEKDIKIVTGLPPRYYDRKGELPDEALWQGFGGLVYIDRIYSFEEGDKVLMVDIGYNTVDYLYALREEEKWKRVSAGTIDGMGVTRLLNIFLKSETDLTNFPKVSLQGILEKGKIKIDGTEYTFSKSLDEAKAKYSHILISKLASFLDLRQPDHIVFSGGGAYYIVNPLPNRKILIPEKAEYLNAKGYCVFCEELYKEEG